MNSRYSNETDIKRLVVSIECGNGKGSGFFIGERKLLTCRHVVVDYNFADPANGEPVIIEFEGERYECEAEEFIVNDEPIDVALLRVTGNLPNIESEYPLLEAGDFIKDLEVEAIGYPFEGNPGKRIECFRCSHLRDTGINHRYGDRELKNEDRLQLYTYEGMSGGPVVNSIHNIIGIINAEQGGRLRYVSFKTIRPYLESKNINIIDDNGDADMTLGGKGHSRFFSDQAIATIKGRYNRDLHEPSEKSDSFLRRFLDLESGKASSQKLNELIDEIVNLPEPQRIALFSKFRLRIPDREVLEKVDLKELQSLYKSLHLLTDVSTVGKDQNPYLTDSLKEKLLAISELDFENAGLYRKRCIKVIGQPGEGKTHMLCNFAEKQDIKENIYIFFGHQFNHTESPITRIENDICNGLTLNDLNSRLDNKNKLGVIIIDAINEGVGIYYWNNHLSSLREKIMEYPNLRLIVSVRSPFEEEIFDFKIEEYWEEFKVTGLPNYEKAIPRYFQHYNIPLQILEMKRIPKESFRNPMFLTVFCISYPALRIVGDFTTMSIFRNYVRMKNAAVSRIADEDPRENISHRYLEKLAQAMVFQNRFDSLPRKTARKISNRMLPRRMWSNDLLNACLTEGLLIDNGRDGEAARINFQFDQMEDFYRAFVLFGDEEKLKKSLHICRNALKFMTTCPGEVSSSKITGTISALFKICEENGVAFENLGIIRKDENLFTYFFNYLLSAAEERKEDKKFDYRDILWKLINVGSAEESVPYLLLDSDSTFTNEEVLAEHQKLKKLPIDQLTLHWSYFVNLDFEELGYDGRSYKEFTSSGFLTRPATEEKDVIIRIWMLSSSHPMLRGILVRQISDYFRQKPYEIPKYMDLFDGITDPYIDEGLYCAIYGALLMLRNKEIIREVSEKIFNLKYSDPKKIPMDLNIRHYTLHILELNNHLNKIERESKEDLFSKALSLDKSELWKGDLERFKEICSQKSEVEGREDNRDAGHQEKASDTRRQLEERIKTFGITTGSYKLYYSLLDSGDFNRYIVGTNSAYTSYDFYTKNDDGSYSGIILENMLELISRYIKEDYKWNDLIGSLDNQKVSSGRFNNEYERLGKKFQWMAWRRINAMMLDSFSLSKDNKRYFRSEKEESFYENPRTWQTTAYPRFDPTLRDIAESPVPIDLRGLQPLQISDNPEIESVPKPVFRNEASDEKGCKYMMLSTYDISSNRDRYYSEKKEDLQDGEIELSEGWNEKMAVDESPEIQVIALSNSAFVRKDDVEKLREWAKTQNFYGRWMPERNSNTGFLWNEYPWSEQYHDNIEEEIGWIQPERAEFEIMISNECQLQEETMGLSNPERIISEVSMPNPEMMEHLKLYCSDIRGVVRKESDGNKEDVIATVDTGYMEEGISGLFIRKELLDKFMEEKNYVLFYYVLGEKRIIEKMNLKGFKRYSGAYLYIPNTDSPETLQELHSIE